MSPHQKCNSISEKFFHKIRQMGARMVAGYISAMVAAMLIFFAPEVGIAGGIGAVVIGGISAVLVRPHITR